MVLPKATINSLFASSNWKHKTAAHDSGFTMAFWPIQGRLAGQALPTKFKHPSSLTIQNMNRDIGWFGVGGITLVDARVDGAGTTHHQLTDGGSISLGPLNCHPVEGW